MADTFKIDTSRVGFRVDIDGVEYDAVEMDDLTLREQTVMVRMHSRLADLKGQVPAEGDAPDELFAEMDGLIESLVAVILRDVPAEIRARIKRNQRQRLISAYNEAMSRGAGPFAKEGAAAEAGNPSSSGSSGSTGAAEGTG